MGVPPLLDDRPHLVVAAPIIAGDPAPGPDRAAEPAGGEMD
jgi:hypothetical protein